MPNILPQFIVGKIFVRDSLIRDGSGFIFTLNNSFAPVVIQKFGIVSDGISIEPGLVTITPQGHESRNGQSVSSELPLPFSINLPYVIRVADTQLPQKTISIQVDTRDAGEAQLNVNLVSRHRTVRVWNRWHIPGWLLPELKASVEANADDVLGEINPFVYGQFIEHLERCIYGGLWTEDGSILREDVFGLVDRLKIPLIRYPGGNFASGYHWEDGIGPKLTRPERFDAAWSAVESNQVGTDEYMAFMHRLGSEPILVVNDGSGTPQEAARWVAYCNSVEGEQARRRAENGHPQPYNVKYWGVGNEVWGKWQIGTTTAENYARRLCQFSEAMRDVDPTIRIVACGNIIFSDSPEDPGRKWNETVFKIAGQEIDHLSFHLYQPDQDGWNDKNDLELLHHTVCAAPLMAEQIIARIGAQLAELSPTRKIGVAFDEWNLWLTPPAASGSMHQVHYTMRDALYCAGMLNVFHRQCNPLSMANLAQLVNVLPLIVTDASRAYPTPMYWPFWLYSKMQHVALRSQVSAALFDSQPLGQHIPAQHGVPYLDVSVTRSSDQQKVSIALINRHPRRKMAVDISLNGFADLQPVEAYLLSAPSSLSVNTFETPENVRARPAGLPSMQGGKLLVQLPPASVLLLDLQRQR